MRITFQPVQVAAGEEGDGCLLYRDQWLVAVLVRLSEVHEAEAGFWFLESGYGALAAGAHPSFPDLAAAEKWIRARLADGPPSWFGAAPCSPRGAA